MAYFPMIHERVPFEGPGSDNPFAFRHYDQDRRVGERTMREWLRFAVCYWHTFRGEGRDPFGDGTVDRRWETPEETLDAAFEFMAKLGVPFWTFHDRDLAPEQEDFGRSCDLLERMLGLARRKQEETGIRLLWGTANLFSHPRYQAGAATNPDPHVFAYAAAQVRHALEATHALGGLGFVFWGGREGYETLLNTDMRREREQMARFLGMAVEHAQRIGFRGQFYLEPKPKEPTKHQYDTDAAACLNFLREFDLLGQFKLNIETNHATLAGHEMAHELRVARHAGALGSIDANQGDELLGWDTDQFPTDLRLTVSIMLEVLRMGGFTPGGLNFDAKVRRASHEPEDLLHGHIAGMDAFAAGLEIAHAIIEDGRFERFIEERYAEWDTELGRRILGSGSLEDCEAYVRSNAEPTRRSGRQEMLERWMNDFLLGGTGR
jgi:xylose isomerase